MFRTSNGRKTLSGIRKLSRHFPETVRAALFSRQHYTIDTMTSILIDYKRQEADRIENQPPRREPDRGLNQNVIDRRGIRWQPQGDNDR